MVHIVGEWFKAEQLGRVIAVLSVSSEVGYLTGKFGFGMLLYLNMNWKYCFFIAAVIALLDNVLSTALLKGKYALKSKFTSNVLPSQIHQETRT